MARAVAPSLPDTLAHCARPRSHSRRRFSVVEKRPRRPFAALSSVVTDSGAASARGTAFFRLCDLFVTHHQRLHRCRHILGRLYSQRACPTIYFAMWAQAKQFEGSPPPPPVIAPTSDSLGGCRIGAVSLGCSCARPRARPAVSTACVAQYTCMRPYRLFGGGDAERARIRLVGRSETAWCNWRREFRKEVFSPRRSIPPFSSFGRRGPENLFFGNRLYTAPRWSTVSLEQQACRIEAVSARVRR